MILTDDGALRSATRGVRKVRVVERRGRPMATLFVHETAIHAFDQRGGFLGTFRTEGQARAALKLPLEDAA
jgi:hypothetical protein